MKKIVIVGGGPAAIAISCKLLEELQDYVSPQEIEINIFEKGNKVGPGLPYSSEEDCYILNLPVSTMRADFTGQTNFSEWFIANFPQIQTQFPSRKYFGYFLIHLAVCIKEQFKQRGFSIKYHAQTEVIDIDKISQDQYRVKTTKNITTANYIVLCTGHMPTTLYRELDSYPGYRHNQWAESAFDNIDSCQTVGIIGSRLSAIDVAMKLREQNHQGKIIMFSRSGLLPAVLSKNVPVYTLKYLTMNNFDILTKNGIQNLPLDKLMNLFWREISEAEGKEISFDWLHKSSAYISALEWMKREIKQAETGVRPWQQVMFAMYPIVPQIWRLLSFSDKKVFMQNYYSLYMTYLAAFPLDNAYKIYQMLSQKQLEVIGGLKTINYQVDEFIINTSGKVYKCKVLFNATGQGYDPTTFPLYCQMSKRGIVIKHHCGGFCVNTQTLQVLDQKMSKQSRIYAIGELTRGSCLATTDMTQLTRQADRAGTHLALSIKSPNNSVFSEVIDNPQHGGNRLYNQEDSLFGFFDQMPSAVKAAACLVGTAVGGYVAMNYFHFRPK